MVRSFVDAVNQQDWTAVETLVSPAFVRHSDAGGDLHGRDALIAFLQGEYAKFPDAHEELEAVITEDDLVAARHVFTATPSATRGDRPPTGPRLRARYLAMYRVADGRIVEAWAEWDTSR